MLLTNKKTAVVSSTDLKRKYSAVKKLLKDKVVIIITNRNDVEGADGILFPYSKEAIEKIEDLTEEIEMEQARPKLIKELEKSYKSGKGKRIPLTSL